MGVFRTRDDHSVGSRNGSDERRHLLRCAFTLVIGTENRQVAKPVMDTDMASRWRIARQGDNKRSVGRDSPLAAGKGENIDQGKAASVGRFVSGESYHMLLR